MKPIQFAMIDPPWHWKPRGKNGDGRSPKYVRQDLNWLMSLDIKSIMARDSMVGLWMIDPMILQGYELAKAWGLKFCSVLFYWAKTNPKEGWLLPACLDRAWFMGNGYGTRANVEQCILFKFGRGLPRKAADVRRLIVSPIRKPHSRKPDEAYTRVERLFGEGITRADIFARYTRPGWVVWGNEVKSDFDIPTRQS